MKMNIQHARRGARPKPGSRFRHLREFISLLEETGNLHHISALEAIGRQTVTIDIDLAGAC